MPFMGPSSGYNFGQQLPRQQMNPQVQPLPRMGGGGNAFGPSQGFLDPNKMGGIADPNRPLQLEGQIQPNPWGPRPMPMMNSNGGQQPPLPPQAPNMMNNQMGPSNPQDLIQMMMKMGIRF